MDELSRPEALPPGHQLHRTTWFAAAKVVSGLPGTQQGGKHALLLLQRLGIHHQHIEDLAGNAAAVEHGAGVALPGRVLAIGRIDGHRIHRTTRQGSGHRVESDVVQLHIAQAEALKLQRPAQHIRTEGGKGHPHPLATQLLDRSDALARHHLIASHRFIEHQHHNGAAIRHAGADIHRLNGGELGDGQITAQVGMHDRLGIGKFHGAERHPLLARQPCLFSQIEVLVARPVGHRHRDTFGGAAATGCNQPQTAQGEGSKRSAGGPPDCGHRARSLTGLKLGSACDVVRHSR